MKWSRNGSRIDDGSEDEVMSEWSTTMKWSRNGSRTGDGSEDEVKSKWYQT